MTIPERTYSIPLPLLTLIIVSAILYSASSTAGSWKKPITVSYVPEEVMLTLSPGEAETIQVEATISCKHSKLSVEASSELAPYITVTPSIIPKCKKGGHNDGGSRSHGSSKSKSKDRGVNTIVLSLTVEIPDPHELKTLEGEVKLKSKKVSSEGVHVSVNVWEGIINGADGYSLYIPPEANGETFDDERLTIVSLNEFVNDEDPRLQISIDENPFNYSVEEFYDGDPGEDLFDQSGNEYQLINVDGINAYKFIPFISFAGDVIVVIPQFGKFIVVMDHGMSFQEDDLFSKIISAIKLGD